MAWTTAASINGDRPRVRREARAGVLLQQRRVEHLHPVLPFAFAAYIATSACCTSSSAVAPGAGWATPTLTPTWVTWPRSETGAATRSTRRWAIARASCSGPVSSTANSSPPSRAHRSCSRTADRSLRATWRSNSSPAECPSPSGRSCTVRPAVQRPPSRGVSGPPSSGGWGSPSVRSAGSTVAGRVGVGFPNSPNRSTTTTSGAWSSTVIRRRPGVAATISSVHSRASSRIRVSSLTPIRLLPNRSRAASRRRACSRANRRSARCRDTVTVITIDGTTSTAPMNHRVPASEKATVSAVTMRPQCRRTRPVDPNSPRYH